MFITYICSSIFIYICPSHTSVHQIHLFITYICLLLLLFNGDRLDGHFRPANIASFLDFFPAEIGVDDLLHRQLAALGEGGGGEGDGRLQAKQLLVGLRNPTAPFAAERVSHSQLKVVRHGIGNHRRRRWTSTRRGRRRTSVGGGGGRRGRGRQVSPPGNAPGKILPLVAKLLFRFLHFLAQNVQEGD